MKQFILTALFVATSFICIHAQVHVYAYKQPVIKGVNNTGGNIKVGEDAVYNYLLYVSSASDITISNIWLNGKLYDVKMYAVEKLPVQINNDVDNTMTQLVPSTTDKVWSLEIKMANADNIKKKACLKKKIRKNELVIAWKTSGKTKHKKVKKIRILPAQVGV